jgi:hypothetical protein
VYAGVHRALPELWPRPGGEEVRGPTSVAVPVVGTGTASVAPVMGPPVPGMQKPPRRVGKRFRDHLMAAPEGKVKKPVGLKTRPAWLRQDRLGARRGVHCRASLEAADGDDLVQGPDLDGEGAGSAAQDGVGAVVERLKGWDDAALTDLDEGGGEEVA